ncbi:hypothetical protein [Ruegeria sp. MALMAid1280]|uniref:hypothetical protein n=1 Tax=Ruegeria sp. MALMAid1280 TaxID=3411634 RepID=UPI003BA23DB1
MAKLVRRGNSSWLKINALAAPQWQNYVSPNINQHIENTNKSILTVCYLPKRLPFRFFGN